MLSFGKRWKRPHCAGLLFAVVLFGCWGGTTLQATVGGRLSQQDFAIWRAEGGWQPNTVTAVIQSHEGYLWLGTYHGLVRYDGARFTVFDSSNTPDLQNGLITSLYEDPAGVLWIGHETGQLTRYAGGQFRAVNLDKNWSGGVIEALATDEAGDLWLLNDSGMLYRVRDGQTAKAPGGASPTRKVALARARNGKLWVVANGTVASLEKNKVEPFQFAEAQGTDYYDRVLPAREGGVWVLGNERIRRWRQGRWAAEMDFRAPPAVTCLLETRSGNLLAGTLRDGLYLLRPGTDALHFSRTNGLSHNWVRALCEDHEGNIWIGTGGGFDNLRPRKVQMLSEAGGWEGCAVLSFSVSADGSAWIGTEGAGLYHYAQEHWTTYGVSSGLSNAFVWSVLETKPGELYVGTWGGGLVVKKGERFESPGDLCQVTEPVVAMYSGQHGELWVGTTSGLRRYENGKLVWSAGKEKLALPDVRAITESVDGTLWFGMSGGGLGYLKEGVLKQFQKGDGLGSDLIVALYAEPDGTLWCGSSDNGLTRLKQGKFAVISTRQGLPNSIISHIVDDEAGNLWLGSQRGIFRASKADLHRCADGQAGTVPCLSYGKDEGLSSLSCSGGFQPGACRTTDGRLWFPTATGLAIIDPAKVSTNAVPPPVVIEEVLVDGASLDPKAVAASAMESGVSGKLDESENGGQSGLEGTSHSATGPFAHISMESRGHPAGARLQRLRIAPGHHQFEFHYTGLSFAAPGKVLFRYRLEGLEPGWSEPVTDRVVHYSYLRPGDYTFQVIACNNDGIWNDTGAALSFTTLPHFWQTWSFEIASMVSGAAAVGYGVLWATRRRVRRKLEQLERQRALERERARIARDIHDDLGASLTRIGMLSQSVRSEIQNQPQAAADVDQIYHTARELTRAMDEIVWAVNPKHDTLDSLVTYLGRFAQNFLSAAAIRCRLDVPMYLPAWALTSEIRHNVFLALKEALNNVVKHAEATEVRISLELAPGGFLLVIADNGRGFDWAVLQARAEAPADGVRLAGGNGVLNMRRRLEEIGGSCEWNTAPGEGTRVKLSVAVIKIHDNRFAEA
ncbi:MAG TPA: two-component regulator propeller domain-containing protein [Candidatus Binatia bacterium]|nr:two-component regulator propeller domain-containing protein [Candidatus Binatia bacterium]